MLRFNDEDDGEAIARAAGCTYNPRADPVISRVSSTGVLMGGVLYQGYTGVTVCLHMAGLKPNWASRDFIWCAFDYPFNQLGCHSVFAQVPASNNEALDIDLRLGFKEIARIPDVFQDGDLRVLRMKREDCKWLAVQPRSIRSLKVTHTGN